MSPTTTSPAVGPVFGPLAKTAARMPTFPLEREHRKLLVLLAAYQDVGEQSPPMRALVRRLGLADEKHAARKVDKRLKELCRAGVLDVRWKASAHEHPRNVYTLRLDGEVW